MEKKVRFIFIGLIALTIVSFIYSFSILGSREALMKEYSSVRQKLKQENEDLAKKLNSVLQDKRDVESRMERIKEEIDKALKERQELQNKYDLLKKEQEDLLGRFKEKPPAGPPTEARPEETRPLETEDAYWARILKEKARLEMFVARLKERLDQFVLDTEELKKDKLALELEVKNLNQDKQNLQRRFVYNEKIIDSLSAELVREKKEKRNIEKELDGLRKEYLALSLQLRTLNETKVSLEKKLKETDDSRKELDIRLSDLNTALDSKILEIEQVKQQLEAVSKGETGIGSAKAKESVELPPIVVRSYEKPQAPTLQKYPESSGKVLAVNREHNFIVIDLGEEHGVRPGKLFNVFRDNKKIGTVEVIQARRSIAACDIKQQEINITVGDSVR